MTHDRTISGYHQGTGPFSKRKGHLKNSTRDIRGPHLEPLWYGERVVTSGADAGTARSPLTACRNVSKNEQRGPGWGVPMLHVIHQQNTRVSTAQLKQGKWRGKNQGKYRELEHFAKTQGILFVQVVKSLILKVKDISIFPTKICNFFFEA